MNNKSLLLILGIIILISYNSCSSQKKEMKKEQPVSLNNNSILRNIKCLKDPSVEYSVYMPKNIDSTKKHPVIILFDPTARANHAIKIFQPFADKFGYILVGSCNSKNGLNMDKHNYFYENILNDIQKTLPIDTRRIYTAGFSGGARVATAMAQIHHDIAGAAGFGAGLASNEPGQINFDYFAAAGFYDFNYNEITALQEKLGENCQSCQYVYFEGKHDWPPKEVISEVFYWFETQGMRKNIINKDTVLLNEIKLSYQKQLDSTTMMDLIQKKEIYGRAIKLLSSLDDVKPYQKEINDINHSKKYKDQIELYSLLQSTEQDKRNEYINAFGTENHEWWRSELEKIQTNIDGAIYPFAQNFYKRLFAFLSMASYLNTIAALDRNLPDKAELFTFIYHKVDPDNLDAIYLDARLFAFKGNSDKALEALNQLAVNGFHDYERLASDKIFVNIKSSTQFIGILNTVKVNHDE